MKRQLYNRVMALICAITLLGGLCPGAAAEESTAVPTLTASTVTSAYPGSTYTLTVKGTDFEEMVALDFMLTYDSNALSVASATASSAMMASVNTTSPGIVQYQGISADGISGSNTLLTVRFTVSADAEARAYPINLLVTQAAKGESNTPVTVSTVAGSVTVRESTATTPTISFYSSVSSSVVTQGEDWTYKIGTGSPRGMAAGQFLFTYDSDKFEYKSLELLSPMTKGEYIHTVNTNNPGQVVLAYTGVQAVSGGYLMQLTLTAKEDASGSTTVKCTPMQVMDVEGNSLNSNNLSTTVTIKERVEAPVYPKVWVDMPETAATNETVTAQLWLEGSAGLAAGDFVVAYDAKKLTCVDVSSSIGSGEDGSADGGVVIINDDWAGGSVRFSVMNPAGISEDTKLVTMTFRPAQNAKMEPALTPSVIKPVDKNVDPVTLECVPAQVAFFVPSFTVTFYDWDKALLSTQSVPYLSAATAPTVPEVNGRPANDKQHYVFSGWDKAFEQVESDLDVTVVYQAQDHSFCLWGKIDEESHARTCEVCGTSEQGSHDFGKWSKEDEANHTRTCADCGATQQGSHEFSKWDKQDEETHARTCADCGATQQGSHEFSKWDKEDEANHTRTCADCGATQQGSHEFSKWDKQDEETHTRTCADCGATQQSGHNFGKWDKQDEESHTRACSDCGATQQGSHDFDKWSKEDEANHTRTCSDCGATQQGSHEFSKWDKEDEESHARTCADCGATQQGSHEFSKWDKQDEESHARTCADCGATQQGSHEFSKWDKQDEESHTRTCSDCGATQQGSHEFSKWDKQDEESHARTCADCGATQQGSHEFSKWGKEDEANHTRTCSDCGATQQGSHDFGKWSKEDEVNHARTCADCGATQRGAHAWDNGDCTLCDCSGIRIDLAEGLLTVKVPGVRSDCQIIISCYNTDKQQLMACCPEQPVRENVWLETSLPEQPAFVKVFFLNEQWLPVRPEIEHIVSDSATGN